MAFFTLIAGRVYAATGGVGSLYLVMSSATGQSQYELKAAYDDNRSSFVFSAYDQHVTAANADAFASIVAQQLDAANAVRGALWFGAPQDGFSPIALMGISRDGDAVRAALNAPIYGGLFLTVPTDMALALPEGSTDLQLGGSSGPSIGFTGSVQPNTLPATKAVLAFEGRDRGAIGFTMFFQRESLRDDMHWGFQILAAPASAGGDPRVQWYPLAAPGPNPNNYIALTVRFDPSDPLNAQIADRTRLVFAPPDQPDDNLLYTYFRTANGWNVNLRPVPGPIEANANAARFVFNAGVKTAFGGARLQLAPEGDFVLEIPGASAGTYPFMPGLQSMEFFLGQPALSGTNGDTIRFVAGCPAYAARFPLPEISPLGPPVDPSAPLLDDTYTTSWMTLVRTSGNVGYVAQPKGSTLYGKNGSVNTAWDRLYGVSTSTIELDGSGGKPYPALPYAGATVRDVPAIDIERIEAQIVGPTRRNTIALSAQTPRRALAGGVEHNVTTPSGVIATLDGDVWTKVLLGKNLEADIEMAFIGPSDELVQAFQTSDLFLVVANKDNLVKSGGTFANTMLVADWTLQAQIGHDSAYDNYANVMIVKGCRGALYDPSTDASRAASFVSNPGRWTQAAQFAQPGTDAGELAVLSNWLQRYFDDAANSGDPSLDAFNAMAVDPNWTGTLVLRADIARVPDTLAGIMAGVRDDEAFKSHHFGVSISPVRNQPGQPIDIEHTSSMFGLISYKDPNITLPKDGTPPAPIPPRDSRKYDFTLLSLLVRFANSAVVTFRSFAQVTLGEIFALQPTDVSSGTYASVVLSGSYQQNGGRSIYTLSSRDDTYFAFENRVIDRVEITEAQMSTRDAGANGTVVSWFAFSGFIDFAVIKSNDGNAFDIFSFGNEAGATTPRTGLAFTNLGLSMSFATATPKNAGFTFDPSEMRFDPKRSTSREASIYRNLALDVQGLVRGMADDPPSKSGYSTVITDAQLVGVEQSSVADDQYQWYGVRYRLDMGSPGALAGNVGLNAYVVTAWSAGEPDGLGYPALFGLQLPGTGGGGKLLSLQTVIKLSIGQLRLTYTQGSFLLMLTEIALKFLGLLTIPPSGSTMFFLFGNPQNNGKPSGLGWYAMYARTDQQQALPEPDTRIEAVNGVLQRVQ